MFACLAKKLFECTRLLCTKYHNEKAPMKETATIALHPYQLHKLKKGPPSVTLLTREDAVKYYTQLVTVRQMEKLAAALNKELLVRELSHLRNGQEAVCVGLRAGMRPSDKVITSYRVHGWVHMMGASPRQAIAELIGDKAVSMYMLAGKFFGGSGILRNQVPLGTGVAFAQKYKNKQGVCLIDYENRPANKGQVSEAFSLAKLWNLPCVYFCENNLYGMGNVRRISENTDLYTKCEFIPGIRLDGMDLLSVREGTQFAINHAGVLKKGPIIIEIVTHEGHSDPDHTYRSRDEVTSIPFRDPVESFGQKVKQARLLVQEDLDLIRRSIKRDMKVLRDEIRNDPDSLVSELT